MVLVIGYLFSLPACLFSDPTSTVIEDRNGVLLGARIAADEQWRFPEMDSVPERFKAALLLFEDRYFYLHPGFNPVSMVKALFHNVRPGRKKMGGSTISMQVIRLSRKGQPRTVFEKTVETLLATRMEWRYPKEKILTLYASHAPFGGNVVGLDAAAWRYFSRSPHELSWAEAATLAVLPNAPSLIFPGRNHDLLLKKRNKLLDALHQKGYFDALTLELSKEEPIPEKPFPLPQVASHLLDRVTLSNAGKRTRTTVDDYLQRRAGDIVDEHILMHRSNEIHNAAAIILDVLSGEVLAYIGNSRHTGSPDQGHQVDIITAPRSTGSILKPILYALMMQEGMLLPNTLVPDIPTQIAGYSPKNFFLTYDGAVPAKRSLSRSLNVPSVRMLRDYGVEKFHHYLRLAGMSTLPYASSHYGLSLILGGAEGSLWDLSGIYASFSRVLRQADNTVIAQGLPLFREPHFILEAVDKPQTSAGKNAMIDAAAVWLTYEALVEVNRPDVLSGWELYSSQGKIAWKTGTSFGGRDAWAIGSTADYVVGVWAGNATGEGRPDLTGLGVAAPLMFDLFDLLPPSEWFEQPYGYMSQVAICRDSGHRAGMHCQEKDTMWVHTSGIHTQACPYHQVIHLDHTGRYRVNSLCEEVSNITPVPWFVLPPGMEWFYRFRNPTYQVLPPYRPGCVPSDEISAMELIYPVSTASIYIPRELDGTTGRAVFEVAHRNPSARLFWHLDDEYIGETRHIHRMALAPGAGFHTLTVVDDGGGTLFRFFEVVDVL